MASITVEINEGKRETAEPQLVSVRHIGSFNHHQMSPARLNDSSLILYEREFDEIQIDEEEVNTDQEFGVKGKAANHVAIPEKSPPVRGFQRVIERVATIVPRKQSVKVTFYPEPMDQGNNSWQGATKNKTVERRPKRKSPTKPFYRRSCFTCAFYMFLILIVVGAIVLIAYDRLIYKTTVMRENQIIPVVDVVEGDVYHDSVVYSADPVTTDEADHTTTENFHYTTREPVLHTTARPDVGTMVSDIPSSALSETEIRLVSPMSASKSTKDSVSVTVSPFLLPILPVSNSAEYSVSVTALPILPVSSYTELAVPVTALPDIPLANSTELSVSVTAIPALPVSNSTELPVTALTVLSVSNSTKLSVLPVSSSTETSVTALPALPVSNSTELSVTAIPDDVSTATKVEPSSGLSWFSIPGPLQRIFGTDR